MDHMSVNSAAYRHETWGPAYLVQSPSSDIGALLMRPGDVIDNHIHEHCDESFIVLEGACTLWVNCEKRIEIVPGDVVRCAPREMHYLVNESDSDFRMIFIKSPASPGDTIVIPWASGDPVPSIPNHDN